MVRNRKWWQWVPVLLIGAVGLLPTGIVAAQSGNSSSSHYQVTQTAFGSSSTEQTCSTQYCAQAGVSATGGTSSSPKYTATFGPITQSQPSLQVIVNSGASDLGTFSTTSTAATATTVKVLSYLSNGYIMQVMGTSPSYNGHSLTAPSTPTASTPGTEQFGINAVANTTPTVGANLVQVPSSQTSFGVVNTNYNTPNKFMYVNGDTLAHSSSASGETDYTISMIVNIASTTPAGHYSGDFSVVVTPVY